MPSGMPGSIAPGMPGAIPPGMTGAMPTGMQGMPGMPPMMNPIFSGREKEVMSVIYIRESEIPKLPRELPMKSSYADYPETIPLNIGSQIKKIVYVPVAVPQLAIPVTKHAEAPPLLSAAPILAP